MSRRDLLKKDKHLGTCDIHGKLCWPSRSGARSVLKKLYPSKHMSVYFCKETETFHIGTTPPGVLYGVVDRRTLYRTRPVP